MNIFWIFFLRGSFHTEEHLQEEVFWTTPHGSNLSRTWKGIKVQMNSSKNQQHLQAHKVFWPLVAVKPLVSLILEVKLRIEREEVMVELMLLQARPPKSSFNFSEVSDDWKMGKKRSRECSTWNCQASCLCSLQSSPSRCQTTSLCLHNNLRSLPKQHWCPQSHVSPGSLCSSWAPLGYKGRPWSTTWLSPKHHSAGCP